MALVLACGGAGTGPPETVDAAVVDVAEDVTEFEDLQEIQPSDGPVLELPDHPSQDVDVNVDVHVDVDVDEDEDVYEVLDEDPGSDTIDAIDATEDGGTPVTPLELELWTFNILNPSNPFSDAGDVDKRTQMVIDAMLERQPDFVALQEVVQSWSIPNRAEFIAQATGYEYAWHQEYSIVLYDEGIAVLSRWPITGTEHIELPHQDLVLFTRFVLGIRAQTPVGEVDFYSTHMTVGGTEQQSADQALAAWQFITERSQGLPAFFAGDLNAEPDTLSMRFLRGEAVHNLEKGDFTDAWLAVNPDDPGWTIDSKDPHDRIDYIYVSDTAQYPPVTESCELIFHEPEDGIYASDHIGVSCRVTLEP